MSDLYDLIVVGSGKFGLVGFSMSLEKLYLQDKRQVGSASVPREHTSKHIPRLRLRFWNRTTASGAHGPRVDYTRV